MAIWTTPLLVAQGTPVRHEALKKFLGLSDAEVSQLQAQSTRSSVALTDSQKAKLADVAAVLERAWIYQAVTLGLINAARWSGGYRCYDEPSYLGLSLTREQFDKLRSLQEEPKALRLAVLTGVQRELLSWYEADLELVNQAIDLGLVSKPPSGEPLCH